MKKYLWILFALLLFNACTLFRSYLVTKTFDKNRVLQTLDFKFKCGEGSFDKQSNCTLKTFNQIIYKNEDVTSRKYKYAIVLEMPKLNGKNVAYWLQRKEVDKSKSDNCILVTSERTEYYYFIPQKVLDVLQNDYKGFRITIVRLRDSKVLFQSKRVMTAQEIDRVVNKKDT